MSRITHYNASNTCFYKNYAKFCWRHQRAHLLAEGWSTDFHVSSDGTVFMRQVNMWTLNFAVGDNLRKAKCSVIFYAEKCFRMSTISADDRYKMKSGACMKV